MAWVLEFDISEIVLIKKLRSFKMIFRSSWKIRNVWKKEKYLKKKREVFGKKNENVWKKNEKCLKKKEWEVFEKK